MAHLLLALSLLLQAFTFVELNCENLFDTQHDEGKNDTEYTPSGTYHWSKTRYWRKLDRTGQTLLSCVDLKDAAVPDMAMLCEVENDTVMRDLTRRSLLRNARYEYVVTQSADVRGIDVALLYSPMSFRLLSSHAIRITPIKGMRPTRDILYAKGLIISGDTLHIVGVHFPSRRGGEKLSHPFRQHAAQRLTETIDSIYAINAQAHIIVAGDFNMYADDGIMKSILSHGLVSLSAQAKGVRGAKGTYRYRGAWGSLDHILISPSMMPCATNCYINDAAFLTEPDERYGGFKPRRNYQGPVFRNGFSDHLPLVGRFVFQ